MISLYQDTMISFQGGMIFEKGKQGFENKTSSISDGPESVQ